MKRILYGVVLVLGLGIGIAIMTVNDLLTRCIGAVIVLFILDLLLGYYKSWKKSKRKFKEMGITTDEAIEMIKGDQEVADLKEEATTKDNPSEDNK